MIFIPHTQYPTVLMGHCPATDTCLPLSDFVRLPIEWIVLDINKEKGYALLISRNVLAWDSYFPKNGWEDSYLRKWLNGDFYDESFSSQEKSLLIPRDNGDHVFILSQTEIEQYLDTPPKRKAFAMLLDDVEEKDRTIQAVKWSYWTSTITQDGIVYVDENGNFDTIHTLADEIGVRPAVYIGL